MFDPETILNDSMESLALQALKLSIKNPRQAIYFARLRRYLKDAKKRRAKSKRGRLHIPPFLIASVTESCNLFCSGCYAMANKCAKAGSELSLDRWRELFKEAQALGISFIFLAGGEPLLRREIILLAGEFPEIVFPVFTNGTLLDDGYISLFEKHRNLIPVLSLEGGKAVTDARRGKGVYDKLAAVMERLKASGVFYGVSLTVTRKNLNEVTGGDFVSGLENSGCSLAFYVEYVPVDGESSGLAPDEADRALLALRLKDLREDHRTILIAFPGDESQFGGCLAAGRGFFYIAADGGAEPCPFSPFSQLNLKETNLSQALQSDFFKTLRESGLLDKPHAGGCVLFENRESVADILAVKDL